MKKINEYFVKHPKYPMMIEGGVTGFVVWFLYIVVYRVFGLNPAFYYQLGEFILGGMIVGAIIGMVFGAIRNQK